MENAVCGLGATLLLYGLASLARFVRWARSLPAATASDPGLPSSGVRALFGRHGGLGAGGLLLVVATAGFFVLVRALLRAGGVDGSGALSIAVALVLGASAAAVLMRAIVDLAWTHARCADLEAAMLGAMRKIARLDAERRTNELCLARALREKEEAEAHAAEERQAHELELRGGARAGRGRETASGQAARV